MTQEQMSHFHFSSFMAGAVVGAAVLTAFGVSQSKKIGKNYDEEDCDDGGLDLKLSASLSRNQIPRFVVPRSKSFAGGLLELDLGGCSLCMLPSEVGSLQALRKLNAAKNRIKTLPDSFKNLTNLRIAFFLGCEFETVPSVLGRLPNLFMLSFKANRLRYIPEDALSPSIGWLILSDNQLNCLPVSIGMLVGLRKCMLAGNRLTDLPTEMGRCSNLELVRLSDNCLRAMPIDLLRLPKLAWIALASNHFNRNLASAARARVPVCDGDVSIHSTEILGEGASGVVYRAEMRAQSNKYPNETSYQDVAVKIFRHNKTSDGDPADEMAAASEAGSIVGDSCRSIVRSFGQLPASPSASFRTSIEAEENFSGRTLGLVLELLDGWEALAGPPSFVSVTRDVYKGDSSIVDSTTGECLAPGPLLLEGGLETIVSILHAVSVAAETLHAKGISHGDLYAHNVLLRPNEADREGSARPRAILSDFGASFFYKFSNKSVEAVQQDKKCSSEHLLERVEVLAFGHFMSELIARVPVEAAKWSESDRELATALNRMVEDCRNTIVASRPSFSDIRRRFDELASS